MTTSSLLDRVRAAQEELGGGDAALALAAVEPLLDETRELLRGPAFLGLSSSARAEAVEAYCYARVTAVLALETSGATEALPRIRRLPAEAADVAQPTNSAWKVLCAAAEMLARSGDSQGAAQAVETAARMAPEGEYYPGDLRASIRDMFPDALPRDDATTPTTGDA